MYQLKISDAYESVDLYQNGIHVLEYVMRAGQPERQGAAQVSDVTESIVVHIDAVSQAAAQDAVRKIERILDRATANRGEHRANAAWLTLRLDSDGEDWRSELLSGTVASINPLDELWKRKLNVTISLTRRPHFEGAEVELPISSNGYAAATGGRIIANGSGTSWIQVASDSVAGSLPAPVRIHLINSSGSTRRISRLWMVNNAHVTPNLLDSWMTGGESDGGTGNIGGGTSGQIKWTMDPAFLDAAKGRLVRALMACATLDTTAIAQGVIGVQRQAGSPDEAWFGPEVATDARVVDLGVFPLPPGAMGGGYAGTSLTVKVTDVDTLAANINHIALIPVSSERFLFAVGRLVNGIVLLNGDSLVDDGIEGECYSLDTGATPYRRAQVLGRGGPLLLFPGRTQRINILHCGQGGAYSAGDQSTVRLWMRPRRATI